MTTQTQHSLNLDTRQREMLAAMGVTYWWPTNTQTSPLAPDGDPPHHAVDTPANRALKTTISPAPESTKTVANNLIIEGGKAVFDSVTSRTAIHQPPSANTLLPAASHKPAGQLGWPALTQAIQSCTACELCHGRKQAVPGMGNPQARWLIVGETPDEQADKQGQPFVGPVGQLLDAMLAAMGLTRETDVYIANVIKCRPPHNRNPEPAEVAHCAPFLMRQIELVQPDMILALGRLAAQTVLAGTAPGSDTLPLGKLRGHVHTAAGHPMVVTYHPTYLLRNPAEKGKVWSDLCLAMAHVGHNPMGKPGT